MAGRWGFLILLECVKVANTAVCCSAVPRPPTPSWFIDTWHPHKEAPCPGTMQLVMISRTPAMAARPSVRMARHLVRCEAGAHGDRLPRVAKDCALAAAAAGLLLVSKEVELGAFTGGCSSHAGLRTNLK